MAYVIETTGLTKRFIRRRKLKQIVLHPLQREAITALNGIDLQIKEGELFGILGPNGAGKTTLIKLLCTLILPDQGKAWVNGYNILHNEESIKQSIDLVTGEERSFYWRLSGRGNFQFFAILFGGVLFPITILPNWLQKISYLLPITYSLRAIRHALLQSYSFQALSFDILMLALCSVVLLPLSIYAFNRDYHVT